MDLLDIALFSGRFATVIEWRNLGYDRALGNEPWRIISVYLNLRLSPFSVFDIFIYLVLLFFITLATDFRWCWAEFFHENQLNGPANKFTHGRERSLFLKS